MIYRFFVCLVLLFFSTQTMNQQKEINAGFFDFNGEIDAACLEKIFQEDFKNLTSAQAYSTEMGVKKFTTLATDAIINVRKIMRVDNNPVAFLIYFVANNSEYKNFYNGDVVLVLMGVHPNERNKKYGSIVMNYFMKNAFNLKAEKVWLSVRNDNVDAHALYKKFGFSNTKMTSWKDCKWWSADILFKNKVALYNYNNNFDLNINFL